MQVKDLDQSFQLVQTDFEISSILEDLGISESYSYLFVKLDNSQADYSLIYGSNNANLDTYVSLLYEKSEICLYCKQSFPISKLVEKWTLQKYNEPSSFEGFICTVCTDKLERCLIEP